MTTFVLKKYDEKNDTPDTTAQQTLSENKQKDEMTVTVVGSISEIVAKALYKALSNKASVEELPDDGAASVKAVSTEDINSAPLEVFNSIQKDDALFIHSANGFKTREEEWFLTNIGNKTNNVFYTVESFITYIKRTLNVSW